MIVLEYINGALSATNQWNYGALFILRNQRLVNL